MENHCYRLTLLYSVVLYHNKSKLVCVAKINIYYWKLNALPASFLRFISDGEKYYSSLFFRVGGTQNI